MKPSLPLLIMLRLCCAYGGLDQFVNCFNQHFPDDIGLGWEIGSARPVWRSPPPQPAQLNPLRSLTFHSVPEIVELIVIKTHLSREFGSNA